MSTLELEHLKHASASGNNITLAADGSLTIGAVTGDFTVDTTTFKVDSTNNRVGIGETSPQGKLHVKSGDSGATADSGANELVVEGSGNAGISLLSGATSSGSIYFGDSGTAYDGWINYSQTDRNLNFATAVATRMTIDSAGRITMPNQPGVSAYNLGFSGSGAGWNGGASTGSTDGGIYSDYTHHNVGNHYNTSTGYFTAPVAGRYLCTLNVYGRKNNSQGDNSGYWWGYFQKNGGYHYGSYIMEAYYNSGDYDQGASIAIVINLAVNDTVRPYMGAYAHGIDVYGANTGWSCQFLG